VKDSLKRNRNWSAQVLTAVAGFVDLTGWVVLYHIYTANMTGNTVGAGLRIGRGDWIRAAARLLPVAAFAVGVLANGIVVRWAARREPKRLVFPLIMAAEAVLLAAFLGLGLWLLPPDRLTAPTPGAWVALATVAGLSMGMQNGALATSGALSIYTTHVTGTLTTMMEYVAEYLVWLKDRAWGRGRRGFARALRVTPRQRCARLAALHFRLWLFYLAGAAAGAVALGRLGVWCLAAPIAAVVATGGAALLWPVALAKSLDEGRRSE